MIRKLALLGCLLVMLHVSDPTFAASAWRDGDIIFHQSQSRQAAAIEEATGSPWSHVGILFNENGKWFVAEASDRVRLTPVKTFIARGKNSGFRVYRARDLKPSQISALRAAVKSYAGKRYDIFFEWSDDVIYCSELIYKTFAQATGIEIGKVQKFSDLRLDGPFVRLMIAFRLTRTGRELKPGEAIVTPIAQMEDTDLDLVNRVDP